MLTNIGIYRAAKRIKILKSWCLHNRVVPEVLDKTKERTASAPRVSTAATALRQRRRSGRKQIPGGNEISAGGKQAHVRTESGAEGVEKTGMSHDRARRMNSTFVPADPKTRNQKFAAAQATDNNKSRGAEGLTIVPLTMQYKKAIVRNMIRANKVPRSVLDEQLAKVRRSLESSEGLEQVVDLILHEYDVIVQDASQKPATGRKSPEPAGKRTNPAEEIIDNISMIYVDDGAAPAKRPGPEKPRPQPADRRGFSYRMRGKAAKRDSAPDSTSASGAKEANVKERAADGVSGTKPKLKQKQQLKLQPQHQPRQDSPQPQTSQCPYEVHPINKVIGQINTFLGLMAKVKAGSSDMRGINELCRRLRLTKARLTPEFVKSKETVNELKEKLLRIFFAILNFENGVQSSAAAKTTPAVKYYVANGNNGQLVRTVMKERWWWTPVPAGEMVGANIVWTPWRKLKFLASLPTCEVHGNKLVPAATVASEPILPGQVQSELPPAIQMCNHLEGNYNLGNKKSLYKNLVRYCETVKADVCDFVPFTFHVRNPKDIARFREIFASYQSQIDCVKAQLAEYDEDASEEEPDSGPEEEKQQEVPPKETEEEAKYREHKDFLRCNKNIWIVKPGENSNRGKGILISRDLGEIEGFVANASTHTYIVQKYLERPLLIRQRKFDIRCFALVTSVNGLIKAYFYQEGYLRTSSKKYSPDNLTKAVHLTNEAIQMKYDDFGKFEAGNKVLFPNFAIRCRCHTTTSRTTSQRP